MKKIFELTNRYIILGTPLILFSLISTVYLGFSARGNLINILVAMILFSLMASAFIAGWGNMLKTAVLEPERDDVNSLIKEFTPGVGEYFLSSLGVLFTIGVLGIIVLMFAGILGAKVIGSPEIPDSALNTAMQSAESLKAFLTSLTPEQYTKIMAWDLLLLGAMAVTYFLELLYLPAVFFKTKNPFIAFFVSLKDLFSKKFFKNLGIYLLIFVVNFIILALMGMFINNTILHFIMTLINFYFITLASVGVFYYYYNNFVKSHLGQNIDTKI